MKKDSNRRNDWNLVPQTKIQSKIILLSAGTALVIGITNGSVIYTLIRNNFEFLNSALPLTEATSVALYEELLKIKSYLFVSSIIFVLLSFLGALYISHRIAGPVYHIKKILHDYQKNNNLQARVKLRPDDDLHDLAEAINQVLDQQQGKKD
ncbi:MAG: hypothetical protein RJB66_1663 [Pseudomonadota bacterium]|jgi:methyl-accepting chemotaxis protein